MSDARTDHPNVIVFFTDQQRWDSTGVHGNPLDLTPNFDRMARQGTHFAHAFTCQPVCGPARACLQTGLYATNTTVFRNGLPLPGDMRTLAHYFGDAGYRTAYIGKWHLAKGDPVPRELQGGYEYWLGANVLEHTSTPYDTVVYDKDQNRVKLPGYRVDALEPHFQNHIDDYVAPDGYRERYAGRWVPPDLAALGGSTHWHIDGYWGIVKRLDEALGRLLDALKSLGLDENTIVLFTSDHGCHFKTRNSEYKRSCHESSIRVPTAATGPGFTGGGCVHQLVSLIDIPPTLLEAAGIPVPAEMEGRSTLPLVRGERVGWPEEVFVQISEAQVGRCVRTKRWKYSVCAPEKEGSKDPDSDHYVEEFLYDLEADPYEMVNLVASEPHREVAEVMRERLLRRMKEAGEEAPTIEAPPAKPWRQRRVLPGEAQM